MEKRKELIYRVRPINQNTLDEITTPYLWFSRPSGFKGDYFDANIQAFVEDTKAIKNGIKHIIPEFPFEEWYNGIAKTGICCFTQKMPRKNALNRFPKCGGEKAICIEYDKNILTSFFENHSKHPLYPCFHKIEYANNPTKLEVCDDWSILWSVENGYKEYRTLANILHSHPRELDSFILKLLTRLDAKHKHQKEERIILGGRNIPDLSPNLSGYKITIPMNTINKIFVYNNVPQPWIDELMNTETICKKIEFI